MKKLIIHFIQNPIFLQRLTQGFCGVLTIYFVTHYLNVQIQGWYYTFTAIAAIYTLFDMGLSVVLVQMSAHIFSRVKWLSNGMVDGQLALSFVRLCQHSARFYAKLSVLYLLIVGLFGFVFFSHKSSDLFDDPYGWLFPWCSIVIFTSLNILTLPYLALIEGSGKINEVYHVRIVQNLLGSLFLWGGLALGYQLWALSMLPMISFIVVLVWLIYVKRDLLIVSLVSGNDGFQWREEVWPLQWRVGLSWLAGYLLMQIYTPILFHFDSAEVAGQMGLSLTIANMLGLIAQSWIALKIPDMGRSVANKDWGEVDAVFKYVFFRSLLIYLAGAILLTSLIIILNLITNFGQRVLPITSFIGLLFVVFVNHVNGAFAAHLRSYKKEPLVFISVISTLITIPAALYGASVLSAMGVVAAILIVQIIFTFPVTFYFWMKLNREWRLD